VAWDRGVAILVMPGVGTALWNSGIYASGGLVYTQWNIRQWRIGLYRVEYTPVADWFILSRIYASGDWFILVLSGI
jgi:hypothetical protein